MSIHVTRAPTVPLTSYDTKRSSHLKLSKLGNKDIVHFNYKQSIFLKIVPIQLINRCA